VRIVGRLCLLCGVVAVDGGGIAVRSERLLSRLLLPSLCAGWSGVAVAFVSWTGGCCWCSLGRPERALPIRFADGEWRGGRVLAPLLRCHSGVLTHLFSCHVCSLLDQLEVTRKPFPGPGTRL
jgi:hypothetical protein